MDDVIMHPDFKDQNHIIYWWLLVLIIMKTASTFQHCEMYYHIRVALECNLEHYVMFEMRC